MSRRFSGIIAALFGFIAISASALAAPPTVAEKYAFLATGGLREAKLVALPEKVILQSGSIKITEDKLAEVFNSMNEQDKALFKPNMFLFLEMMATQSIFLNEAHMELLKLGNDVSKDPPQKVTAAYIAILLENMDIAVKPEEAKIITENPNLDETSKQVHLNKIVFEKKDSAKRQIINELGKRVEIEISEDWVKAQAALVEGLPYVKLRKSGKPAILIFNNGSRAQEMIGRQVQPMIDQIFADYKGKIEVLSMQMRENPALANCYEVHPGLPIIYILLDESGKEAKRLVAPVPDQHFRNSLNQIVKKP